MKPGQREETSWWLVGIRIQHCLVMKENIQISAPSTVASVLPSDVLSTVRTEDVVSLCEEASAHQGQGTLLTVKAVVVPLAFLKRDVLCATETCAQKKRQVTNCTNDPRQPLCPLYDACAGSNPRQPLCSWYSTCVVSIRQATKSGECTTYNQQFCTASRSSGSSEQKLGLTRVQK